MKLWADRDELTEVRWFFCEPGAKVYSAPSQFRSWWEWDRKDLVGTGVGEKRYLKYDKGANPLGYKGQSVCGSRAAWRDGGLAGRDPVITTRADGWSDCCGAAAIVACGKVWPHSYGVDPGTPSHCDCVLGELWELKYRGNVDPTSGLLGFHFWSIDAVWYEGGEILPPTPETPLFGACLFDYGGGVKGPIWVRLCMRMSSSCQVQLVVLVFIELGPGTGTYGHLLSTNQEFRDPFPDTLVVTWDPLPNGITAECQIGPPFPTVPIKFTATPLPE